MPMSIRPVLAAVGSRDVNHIFFRYCVTRDGYIRGPREE